LSSAQGEFRNGAMNEPRPPATPPPVPKDVATGEWSDVTAQEVPVTPDTPTVTASGQPSADPADLGIPNPFGRYTITRLLGRGGMGAVFLAHDNQLHRPVALKIPTFGGTITDDQKGRFFREARSVAALHHPNICQVFDVDEEQGILFLTTQFVDGQPLSKIIEKGPMSPDKAVELVRKVARAMQAAHVHGTIHRDLKPANILIDRNGEPVVMDFGLAKQTRVSEPRAESKPPVAPDDESRAQSADLTQYGSVLGTPAYMPPEQARGDVAAIGRQSDIYSLGVILFELLTGRRPFAADDTNELIEKIVKDPPPKPSEFYPWLNPKIEAACLQALAKSPDDRFVTMAQFERALADAVEPDLELVTPPLPPKTRKPKKVVVTRRGWGFPLTCLGISLSFLIVCVGGPTAAILYVIDRVKDTVKEIQEAHQQSAAEWAAIMKIWQQPPADAGPEVLFPQTVTSNDGKDTYRLTRTDKQVADTELGINLPGHRGVYTGPAGEEIEVRAYQCSEAQAKGMQARVQAFIRSVQSGSASWENDSKRRKVIYTSNDSATRSVTWGFSDTFNQNHEFGKLWYSQDWLFYFRTTMPLIIESFPSKYLLELGNRVHAPPPEAKKEPKKRK
jgi:serine/threonine protein kinase